MVDLQFCARIFPGLRPGAGRSGFRQLQEAGRQVPEAAARLDGAPTEQDAPLPGGDGADDDLGILVGDKAAVAAHEAAAVVALRDAALEMVGVRQSTLGVVNGGHGATVAPAPVADKTAGADPGVHEDAAGHGTWRGTFR